MPLRRLNTKGLYNARDLGGFPTADGRVTRFGVFVRSEAPVGLSPEDIAYLRAYGVAASVDLRGGIETRVRPSDLAQLLPYYHRPLLHEAAIPKAERLREEGPGRDWGREYITMAEGARAWARDVLALAAETEGTLLFHCTTGKDRTGLLTCYLLSIAGVSRADIIADYCVSQVYLQPVYKKMLSGEIQLGPPPGSEDEKKLPPMPPLNEGFFSTRPENMQALLDYMDESYGGVAAFLREAGVSAELMQGLRQKLTEEEPPGSSR